MELVGQEEPPQKGGTAEHKPVIVNIVVPKRVPRAPLRPSRFAIQLPRLRDRSDRAWSLATSTRSICRYPSPLSRAVFWPERLSASNTERRSFRAQIGGKTGPTEESAFYYVVVL